MRKMLKERYLIVGIIIFVLLFAAGILSSFRQKEAIAGTNTSVSDSKLLPVFTSEQLKKYNGTDLSLPIYLALDGSVYDVSKGSEFYKVGGPYHYLAGKDSSFELHIVGGDIIKRKYPIVGRYISVN